MNIITFALRAISGKDNSINYILFFLAAASAYFSFRGMALEAQSFWDTAGATIFGLASGFAIYLFWHNAMRVVPRLKKIPAIIAAWLTIAFGIFLILWQSSALNATAFKGLDAVEYNVRDYSRQTANKLDERYQMAQLMAGLLKDLEGHAARYKQFSKDEFSSGIYSDVAGTGAVHRSLVSLEGRIIKMLDDAEKFLEKSEVAHKEVSSILAEMREVSKSSLPIDERMNLMNEYSDDAQRLLAELDPRILAASIQRTVGLLPDEIDFRVKYSDDPAVAKRQREALERLRDDVKRTSTDLGNFAGDIARKDIAALKRFEAYSPSKAVLVYWDRYAPIWIAAIAIDIAPLTVLIIFTLALARKTEREIKIEKVKGMTVEEVSLGQIGMGVINSSPRGIDSVAESMIGAVNDGENND